MSWLSYPLCASRYALPLDRQASASEEAQSQYLYFKIRPHILWLFLWMGFESSGVVGVSPKKPHLVLRPDSCASDSAQLDSVCLWQQLSHIPQCTAAWSVLPPALSVTQTSGICDPPQSSSRAIFVSLYHPTGSDQQHEMSSCIRRCFRQY